MAREKGPVKGRIVIYNDDTQESTFITLEPIHVGGDIYELLLKAGRFVVDVKNDGYVYADGSAAVASATTNVGTGDDTTTNFTATLTAEVVAGTVSIKVAGAEVATDDGNGNIVGADVTGTIDYVTGSLDITFGTAPASGDSIDADYLRYTA